MEKTINNMNNLFLLAPELHMISNRSDKEYDACIMKRSINVSTEANKPAHNSYPHSASVPQSDHVPKAFHLWTPIASFLQHCAWHYTIYKKIKG
jgi:hypothetical protein